MAVNEPGQAVELVNFMRTNLLSSCAFEMLRSRRVHLMLHMEFHPVLQEACTWVSFKKTSS
jgi:hypothetical protein